MTDLGIDTTPQPKLNDENILDVVRFRCIELNKALQFAKTKGLTVFLGTEEQLSTRPASVWFRIYKEIR